MKSVCETIKCPFFCSDTRTSYGCQRYSVALHCHLTSSAPGDLKDSTQYALHASDEETLKLKANEWQELNNAFMLSDQTYAKRMETQKRYPARFVPDENGRAPFKVSAISSHP